MTLNNIYDNPILDTDCYNLSHYYLKKNLDWEVSHIYNRAKGMFLYGFNETVVRTLNVQIFEDKIVEASELADKMGLKFPTDMWFKVAKDFKGRIPLRVQAVPDGTWCPAGTPFAQITNTEEGFGELVTWFEAPLLRAAFPSGCATMAYNMRKYLDDNKLSKWRFHSFGSRGHNSKENAYWAGTAWNLFLHGTDDFHTVLHTPKADIGSIAATAHKTIQQFDDELEGYLFSLESAHKNGQKILSVVIDTYDSTRFIRKYARVVAQKAKDLGMTVVFRPDSGEVVLQAIELYEQMQELGFDNTSVIIGDSVSFDIIKTMDSILRERKVPLSYVNYGVGAGFYKHIDRDYTGWAMKTAYSNGAERMKFSSSFKQSLPGFVNIVRDESGQLIVDYTTNGLYIDLYHFDERSSRPKTHEETWESIQKRALKQNTSQQVIKISPLVQEKINFIKEKYGV